MTDTVLRLSEDEFDDSYSPIPNHIDRHAGWVYGEGRGCLFGTYGDEFAYVRRFAPDRVWTLLDGDDGDLYLVSGLHVVNRVGYLLTREAVPPDTVVEVHFPCAADDPESKP